MPVQLRKFLPLILFGLAIFIVAIVMVWISGQSRIKIIYSGDDINITVINQDTQKNTVFSTNSAKEVTVRKGNYQLMARDEESRKSYTTIFEAPGFFRETTIEIGLSEEEGSVFVGNSPGRCSYFEEILISYDCLSSIDSMKAHLAPGISTPSYTKKLEEVVEGTMSEIFVVNNVKYVVVQQSNQRLSGRNAVYRVVGVANNTRFELVSELGSLDSTKVFNATAYKNGFLVYTDNLDGVYYFPTMEDLSQVVFLSEYSFEESVQGLGSAEINTSNETMVVTVNNRTNPDRAEDTSVVMVGTEKEHITKQFDTIIAGASLCNLTKLCVIEDNNFVVYEIRDDSLQFLYKYIGVGSFLESSSSVYLALKNELVRFNLETREGYSALGYPNATTASLNQLDNGVIVSISSRSSSNALLVGKNYSRNNLIKALEMFENEPIVNTVSIYRNKLFITPSIGDLEYIVEENIFDYNPTAKLIAENKIQEISKNIGLNTGEYEIVNLLK